MAVSGGIGRRFATGVAVTTAALGSFGAALAVAAVVRGHLPVLDWGERVRLVLRWTAVGALGGLGVGVAAGLLSGFVARRWVRGILVGLLVAASIVPVLLAGRRSPGVPWSALGAPQEYPPLAERRAVPGAPNLVLVTIDTLRHDHLQLYGYERPTAPHLAVLARGGTVFEAAVAQAPETLHSLASLMTGLYPHVLDKEFEDRGQAGSFIGAGTRVVCATCSTALASFCESWWTLSSAAITSRAHTWHAIAASASASTGTGTPPRSAYARARSASDGAAHTSTS